MTSQKELVKNQYIYVPTRKFCRAIAHWVNILILYTLLKKTCNDINAENKQPIVMTS